MLDRAFLLQVYGLDSQISFQKRNVYIALYNCIIIQECIEVNSQYNNFLKEIKPEEMKKWKPQKQSMALEIIEAFLMSSMEMAQVNLDRLPEPEQRGGSRKPSSKQDSFASSFYAWKKKPSTKPKLKQLGLDDILIIRRGKEVALKKVRRRG
jgi:hypothetical protein